MPNGGPNPVLLVRDHIAEYIRDLEDERERTLARLREIDDDLAVARRLRDVGSVAVPASPPPSPSAP